MLQLAPPPTANPALGWRRLDAAGVEEKFGVPPALIVDYLALVGDTSDNIPGLKGVGPKTAVKWLQQYGGLDGVLAAAETIEPARFRDQIRAEADRIRANLSLVRFRTDFAFEPGDAPAEDVRGVVAFLESMEMHSTLRRYQAKHGLGPAAQTAEPAAKPAPPKAKPDSGPQQGELF